jgi:hypothetical protein
MTPNIKLARQAVAAELAVAKQGMAYYLSRVEALERKGKTGCRPEAQAGANGNPFRNQIRRKGSP